MSGLRSSLCIALAAAALASAAMPAAADVATTHSHSDWALPGEGGQAAAPAPQEIPDWLPKDAPAAAPVQPFSRIDALQAVAPPAAPAAGAAFQMLLPQTQPAAATEPAPQAKAPGAAVAPFALPQSAAAPAQPATAAPPPAAENAPAAAPTVDLTALRYYASKNDVARVAAEIRRIRSTHPDWTPPETLFSEQKAATDEQPMWNLYAQGKLEDIYKLIEAQKAHDPTYAPSADLVQKLKAAEGRRAIQAAVDAKAYDRVLVIAQQLPDMLVCGEMQMMWNVGEAFAKTGAPQRAFQLYSYILSNCDNKDERFATVQKASELLPEAALPYLVRLGRTSFDGSGEFDGVVMDAVRRKVGDAMAARRGAAPGPSSADIERLKTVAAAPGREDDALLLAWYFYNKQDFPAAKDWFDHVLKARFDLKAVEGYILALRANKEGDEARAVALEYCSQGFSIAKLYIEIVSSELTDQDPTPVPDATLSVLKTIIDEHKSALGAQSLAWYLFNNKAPKDARDWFEKSVAWEPTEEGILGLAIAQNKLGNRKAVKDLAANYGDDFPTLDAFVDRIGPDPAAQRASGGRASAPAVRKAPVSPARSAARSRASGGDPLMKEALAAYQSGQYDTAIEKLDARRAQKGETDDVTVLRGWALHNRGSYKAAYEVFTQLDKQRSTKKTREGVRYSWERMMPPHFH